MKLLICSDIHGDLEACERVISAFKSEGADKLIILGDILYHGPRNDLPEKYNPKGVISLINEYSEYIIATRGNCDSEVDQMVLNFPILADYTRIFVDDLMIFATHGHIYNTENIPPIAKGEILLHGHTHVQKIQSFGNKNLYINPGSISMPKEDNPKTYLIYEHHAFTIKTFDGEIVNSIKI
jgi:putative phosphoesterase